MNTRSLGHCYPVNSLSLREKVGEWVDYRCRAEFIRPTAILAIGDKEVTLSYDALCRGRHSLQHQVFGILTITPIGIASG